MCIPCDTCFDSYTLIQHPPNTTGSYFMMCFIAGVMVASADVMGGCIWQDGV